MRLTLKAYEYSCSHSIHSIKQATRNFQFDWNIQWKHDFDLSNSIYKSDSDNLQWHEITGNTQKPRGILQLKNFIWNSLINVKNLLRSFFSLHVGIYSDESEQIFVKFLEINFRMMNNCGFIYFSYHDCMIFNRNSVFQ